MYSPLCLLLPNFFPSSSRILSVLSSPSFSFPKLKKIPVSFHYFALAFLGKDTCQGDSGGPMVSLAATGLSYELTGVTSWGSVCANAAYPDRWQLLASPMS